MRDFKKIKELSDWSTLDEPKYCFDADFEQPREDQQILRMIVKSKYENNIHIPEEIGWLRSEILRLNELDKNLTGIQNSWCYVTVRKGIPYKETDEWHFDGGSLRTELIPERNYICVDRFPTQYKIGGVHFPDDFDPVRHNMFSYAKKTLEDEEIKTIDVNKWYLLTPFCFHRRDPASNDIKRLFVRVTFVDIEVRDVRCTQNPLLPTDAYQRDPVSSFRIKLVDY